MFEGGNSADSGILMECVPLHRLLLHSSDARSRCYHCPSPRFEGDWREAAEAKALLVCLRA